MGPTPFILGKRVRAEDDSAGKEDVSTMGPLGGGAATGSFWAVPARPDFWSYAAAPHELVVQPGGAVSVSQPSPLFLQHQQQQAVGEASAARVGNYLPGHLNLLASLSGGPGNSGRREDDPR